MSINLEYYKTLKNILRVKIIYNIRISLTASQFTFKA